MFHFLSFPPYLISAKSYDIFRKFFIRFRESPGMLIQQVFLNYARFHKIDKKTYEINKSITIEDLKHKNDIPLVIWIVVGVMLSRIYKA